MTITESMILGTPPVVTAYLSANEQIEHETEGLVVENRDDSVKEAILRCLKNEKILKAMKNNLCVREYGNSDYIFELEEKLFICEDHT